MRVVFVSSPALIKTIRISCVALVLLGALFFAGIFTANSRAVTSTGLPLSGITVVIDPGHGGYDPGVTRDNIEEKNVVLGISYALRDYLQTGGARVVMTRESDRDLLVLPTAGPKKKQDMKHRLFIIHSASPDLVVSIHANAISAPRWRGAQVFYNADCETGKRLAELIQTELANVLKNTDRQAKPGNYLILNEAGVPAVLVESGFLSNPAERELLSDEEYQSQLAWAVYLGITRFLNTPSS
ncbi:MAG: N-acetylmuramoyl-L-alanine amidase [Clostridiales bacterium]|jgi:N-acetylmuramoyl-L-alanine amidase|nr:N-acetylmuramoyl-L-alanine amidase [Clostridiales bacterium]